jgi:hypothetical protein
MTAQRERVGFVVLAMLAGLYVVLRAALVPWVHDECASLYWFVERGEYMPFQAHWDANNHVLSSAIGTWAYRLAGLGLFVSRIGSVLAFVVYAWASYHLGRRVQDDIVRWCLWAALLGCPFVIEFFSLFRGYGLEVAFWLVAIEGLLRLTEAWRTRHLGHVLVALFLANAAVLALLPLWALVVASLGVFFVRSWNVLSTTPARLQQVVAYMLLGVVPLLLGVAIAFELRAQGLLYHGSTEGFRAVTVSSLMYYVFHAEGMGVHLFVMLVAVLATLAVVFHKGDRRALLVVSALLWADVLMRIAMAHFLHVNYPKDRAAIHLVPLFILVFAYGVDAARLRWPSLRWAALLLLAFPLRLLFTMNTTVTSIWPEQSVPGSLLERIATPEGEAPAIIGAYHQLQLVVPYGARLHGLRVPPMHWEGFPNERYDRVLVDERMGNADRAAFGIITQAPLNGLVLMEREQPLQWIREREHRVPVADVQQEFIELWRGDTLKDDRDRVLEVEGTLGSAGVFAAPELVSTVKGPNGDLFYQPVPFALERPVWSGQRFHRRILIPAKPGATGRVVYIWNVRRQALHFDHLNVIVYSEPQDTLR